MAFIHDVEWHESDGTKESFSESNSRFRRNGCKVASAAFGWWRPRRYLVMWDSVKFARICRNRPLRVVATRGEATKPSVSECRAFRLERVAHSYEARQKGGEA